ncbi:tetratricopeptide repeat protein [uncultured Campylobacter sp.]|uniref:tetratricopeptide repeat protein n=1 Tax=uncultured Campylobacter sp. TaxID=218934 RepID=UPI00261891A0|nr:tetratricopeptide repeat protein [uncultured Campylobacter sp.]
MKKVILGILVFVFGSVLSANGFGLDNFKQDCKNGNSQSCAFYYGMKFRREKPDIGKLEKECKKENMDSCFELALAYMSGIGVKKDSKKMNEYLNMCCQKDNLVACHSIAENYELEQNYDKAVEYYIMNCDKGYAGSCTNLGILYHVGDKIKQDYKKANNYFSKACDGGEPRGCFSFGVAYRDGKGVKQDTHKALKYFDIACDGGFATGCKAFGSFYYSGLFGIEEDYEKAFDSFKKACYLGDKESCQILDKM